MFIHLKACVKHHNMYVKIARCTTIFGDVCFDYGKLFEDSLAQNTNLTSTVFYNIELDELDT